MATQVERDEPELRGAVAAAAEVSELRAARDAVGREHAAAMAAHGQESATLHDEHARSVHEQGVARAQLEADHEAHEVDHSALDGRVASLQQQVARLELERREGAEELEQWRQGKLRFSRSRGGLGGWDALQLNKDLHTRPNSREGLCNKGLHVVTSPPALRSVKSLPRRRSSYSI